MTQFALEEIAAALVSEGKGILAADETVPTLSKRFAAGHPVDAFEPAGFGALP
jgi:fructose-bisphosphate aldolase class 1